MSGKKERFLCGVVEGFYGRPWTMEQRLHLFSQISQWGLSAYLYAPKDDDKHRAYWRELYTLEEADHLTQLIQNASSNGISFIYAISPGLDITFSSDKEVALLQRKLDQVKALGCKSFALLFDDIDCDMCPADAKVFASFAHAQVTLSNEMFSHLDRPEVFLFCPTEYCATRAVPDVGSSQYLIHIGEQLHSSIDVMWTGPKVISKAISEASIDELSKVLQRPPVIWDNLHANDYDHRRLFLGPYAGRPTSLLPKLNGVLTNPNCEYGANYVAIHSLAQWSRCADVLTRRASANWRDMHLELEGTNGPCEKETLRDNANGTSMPDLEACSPHVGLSRKAPCVVLDCTELSGRDVEEWHFYDQKQALDVSLKEWVKEFDMRRCSAEHYRPAKDPTSVSKAKDPIGNAAAGDDHIDTLVSVPEVPESPTEEGEEAARVCDDPFGLEDLHLLVDFFFLPHQHGERALHILKEFIWLKGNAPGYEPLKAFGKLDSGGGGGGGDGKREAEKDRVPGAGTDGMRSDGEMSEGVEWDTTQLEVDVWCERTKRFHERCNAVSQMYSRLTSIANRPLLYDLYQYAWDAKENTMLLDSYISWLEAGGSEVNPEHEPHVEKGGIVSEMQSLLPQMDSPGELFSRRKPPTRPSAQVYSIRPYRSEDKALLYQTCLLTGNSGGDASGLMPNFPNLLGDRFVGPYLALSPELCFSLEDSEGVCGYVLGALDSQQFYDCFKREWLPTVIQKYPEIKPTRSKGRTLTPEQELLTELHNVSFFLPASLQNDYPSHLHVDLMERAQGQGIGGRMIKTVLSALKAKGSHGVHLEMSASNNRAMKFYLRLGFVVLEFDEELCNGLPVAPPADVLILGRVL